MSPITGYNDRTQLIPNDLYPLGKKKSRLQKTATILFPNSSFLSESIFCKGSQVISVNESVHNLPI